MHQLIDKKNKVIIYILLLFILSTTSGKFIENQNNRTSKINKINIEGLSNNDNTKIYNQLNNLFSRNILFIHKEEIQEVLNKYNIIEEYSIKKIYPSTINIRIKPTKFIARLSSNDQLIGENGKLIEDRKNKDKLPYVFGKFNSKEFLSFRKNITQSQFTFTEFKMLYFFPSNRWDILTYNDILIKLPQGDIFKSLNLAHKIINMNNFNDKNIIDLRVKNHLIVK
jgi:cell division protein FtsQ